MLSHMLELACQHGRHMHKRCDSIQSEQCHQTVSISCFLSHQLNETNSIWLPLFRVALSEHAFSLSLCSHLDLNSTCFHTHILRFSFTFWHFHTAFIIWPAGKFLAVFSFLDTPQVKDSGFRLFQFFDLDILISTYIFQLIHFDLNLQHSIQTFYLFIQYIDSLIDLVSFTLICQTLYLRHFSFLHYLV